MISLSPVNNPGEENHPVTELDLSSKGMTEFPKNLNNFPLKILKFNNNPIFSLSSLPQIPTLEELYLDGTRILSFESALPQPNLRIISFENTPICKCSFLSFMCVIVFGNKVQKVNDRFLNDLEINACNQIKNRIYQYLTQGWVMYSYEPLCVYNYKTKETLCLSTEDTVFQPAPKIPSINTIPSTQQEQTSSNYLDQSSIKRRKKRKKHRNEPFSLDNIPKAKPKLFTVSPKSISLESESDSTTFVATIVFSSETDQSSDSDVPISYMNTSKKIQPPNIRRDLNPQQQLVLKPDAIINSLDKSYPYSPQKNISRTNEISDLSHDQQLPRMKLFPPPLQEQRENNQQNVINLTDEEEAILRKASNPVPLNPPAQLNPYEAAMIQPTLVIEGKGEKRKRSKKPRRRKRRHTKKTHSNASSQRPPPFLSIPPAIQMPLVDVTQPITPFEPFYATPKPQKSPKHKSPLTSPKPSPRKHETPKESPRKEQKQQKSNESPKPKKQATPQKAQKNVKQETKSPKTKPIKENKTLPKAPPLPPTATPQVITKGDSSNNSNYSGNVAMSGKPEKTKPKEEPASLGGISKPLLDKKKRRRKIIKKKHPRTLEGGLSKKNTYKPIIQPNTHTEVFETEDDSENDNDPPIFKKVDFFKLIGVEPDSGDEYLSQDESTESEDESEIEGDDDIIEELKAQGRQKFYQVRTPETSTTDEMEKFVNSYVRESLKNM